MPMYPAFNEGEVERKKKKKKKETQKTKKMETKMRRIRAVGYGVRP